MPPELAKQPDAPIVRRVQAHRAGERSVEQSMDRDWPHESPEGQARVHFFRALKKVLKTFAGRMSFHNFASGGACPEEATAVRRVDRLYHKEIISVGGEMWVIFSVSADALLRGQMRRMIGLSIALSRGWLPEEYLQVALNKSLIAEVPAVPGWGMYVAECRYSFWEAKFPLEKLDPRRVEGGDGGAIVDWTKRVHERIAAISREVGDDWLFRFETQCREMSDRHLSLEALRLRSDEELSARFVKLFGQKFFGTRRETTAAEVEIAPVDPADAVSVDTDHQEAAAAKVLQPAHDPVDEYYHSSRYAEVNCAPDDITPASFTLYREVLRLLHEVEASGRWPLSSTGRQKVIEGDTLVENGGFGGSFSVGCLPKHLSQPKGNQLFPELLRACFRLEAALCPDRAPSSTIAINRHAQFLPHRDSGAGSGQSKSLIVALGDFVGGEVVVESVPHDIRYRPLEFDGWTERHWTLPFVGERYSLVWFTPLSVVPEDLFWWVDGKIQ